MSFEITRLKTWTPVAAVVALLLIVAWMAGLFSPRIEPGLHPVTEQEIAAAVAVTRETRQTREPVPASIAAKQATVISSRTLARITTIQVSAGDAVTRGQTLINLENDDARAQVERAQSQIDALQARLTEARRDLERATQLRNSGVLSEADLERARANHDSLKAELTGAERALDQAQTALDYSRIQSPIDGLVIDRFAEPGDTVSPGMPILSLYNPTTLRIEAQVRETLALKLAVGQPLDVEIPSLDLRLQANIEELVPAANPGSRSFLVKARLPEYPGLQPGMYARLLVPSGTEEQLLIPADRIAEIGQMQLVWVLVDGRVERRFVRTGNNGDNGLVQITSGLVAGERVLPVPENTEQD